MGIEWCLNRWSAWWGRGANMWWFDEIFANVVPEHSGYSGEHS